MNKGQLLEQVFAHYENLQKQRKAEYLLRLDEARKNADFRALDDKIRDLEFEIAKKKFRARTARRKSPPLPRQKNPSKRLWPKWDFLRTTFP